MQPTLRPAQPDDRDAVEALLLAAALPLAGVAEHFDTFCVAVDSGERILGVAGLELYGACALLRSVAVAPNARGAGLGASVARAALARAYESGIHDVYLLTTTAAAFFEKHGFERIERSQVPSPVTQSVEFCGVCPATATVMHRHLGSR